MSEAKLKTFILIEIEHDGESETCGHCNDRSSYCEHFGELAHAFGKQYDRSPACKAAQERARELIEKAAAYDALCEMAAQALIDYFASGAHGRDEELKIESRDEQLPLPQGE